MKPTFNFLTFLLLFLATRLIGFATPSLWYDESVTIYRAGLPFMAYLQDTQEAGGYNLWDLLMRPFVHGPLWLVRLPALACSLGTCVLAWMLMEKLEFSDNAKRTAAAGIIFLPGLLWVSQDARCYSAFALAYLGAVWCALSGRWLGLGALAGLLFYIHPTAAAFGMSALVLALVARMPFRQVAAAAGIAILSWIPRLIILSRLPSMSAYWLTENSLFHMLYQTVQGFFVNTISGYVFLAAIALIYLLVLVSAWYGWHDKRVMLLFIAALTPIALMLLESALWKPSYIYRTMQAAVIPFCLLTGLVIAPRLSKPLTWVMPALCGCVLLIGFANYNPATRGGYTEQTAGRIRAAWQSGDVIVYEDVLTAGPYDYYLHDLPHCTQSPSDGWFEHCQVLPARYWLISTTEQRPDLIPFAIDDKWQMPIQRVWYIQ
jgi:hypothetical protein